MRSPGNIVCFAALALIGCGEQVGNPQLPDATSGTRNIEALLVKHDIPGLAVGYIDDCKAVRTEVFGLTGDDGASPVTQRTAFEAGSVTKPVFAHLVMEQVERGLIDLDAPLADTFAYPRLSDQGAYRTLTLRQILSHRSGLPNWAGNSGDPDRQDPIPSLAPPDQGFHYSGEAYWLAEQYVEATTGQSFADLFQTSLGEVMPLSTPIDAPAPGAEMSRGHFKNGRSRRLAARASSNAAFSLQTVITDFANYAALICDGGKLKSATYEEMLTPVTRVKGDEYGGDPSTMNGEISYGLGWSILENDGRRVYFHGGTTGAYEAFAAFDPTTRNGYVFLANSGHGLDLVEELAPDNLGDLSAIEIWFN
ncbi:MAG: serine hydrolase domain-containing protein [Pseudomonadota bacterium]